MSHVRGNQAYLVIASLVVLFAAAFLGHASAAPDSVAIVREELQLNYGTQEQLDATIYKVYGEQLSRAKADVATRHLKALLFHPQTAAVLAKFLAPLQGRKFTAFDVKAAVGEGMTAMQVKGLARLPAKRQAAYIQHIVAMLKDADAETCKTMAVGDLNAAESRSLELQYIAALPLTRFEQITVLYRESIEAELNSYPSARTLTSSQTRTTARQFDALLATRLRANVPQAAIDRYDKDASAAPATEVCKITIEIMQAMLDLPQPYRSWQLTRFIESLQ